jgi:DNA-binding SARP family transcriptional activator
MPTWQIYLLGALQILRHGQMLPPFPTRKAKALFSYLVLHRNRPLARDSLAQTLWQDAPEPSARKCLRNELWRIRRVLDPDGGNGHCLRIDGGAVRFDAEDVWIDVARFEEALAEEGRPHLPPSERIRQLYEAVELYRGDLLEESDEEWCYGPRERLRQGLLVLLERLLDHHWSRGDWRAARGLARRMLQIDPLLEHVHRKLMLCHLRLGDRATALRELTSFSDLLRRELAVEPMEETLEVYRQVEALPVRTRSRAVPPPPDRSDLGQLLSHLDLLQRDLEQAARSLRRVISHLGPLRR